MKYLAIDFGTKRLGLAVSDPSGSLAFPLKTVYKSGKKALFEELVAIIHEVEAQAIVLGLPLPLEPVDDDEEPLIVRQVRNFRASLERRVDIPIHFQDERMSSAEAEDRLKSLGARGDKLKNGLDMHAAVVILESFLQSSRTGDGRG